MSADANNPYQPTKIFERFSSDIRHAMKLANREAKRRHAVAIETLDLLTALVLEPTGLGGNLLRQHGITDTRIRSHCRHLRAGREWLIIWGKLPLSTKTKQSIDSAINLAVSEKHDSVGTGSVLYGMMKTDEATTTLLSELRVDVCKFEQELGRYLHRLMVEAPGQPVDFDAMRSAD